MTPSQPARPVNYVSALVKKYENRALTAGCLQRVCSGILKLAQFAGNQQTYCGYTAVIVQTSCGQIALKELLMSYLSDKELPSDH